MVEEATCARSWLLIEASSEGVLRFATAAPSARPRVTEVLEINIVLPEERRARPSVRTRHAVVA